MVVKVMFSKEWIIVNLNVDQMTVFYPQLAAIEMSHNGPSKISNNLDMM